MEDDLLLIDDNCMTRVRAALITRDHIRFCAEQIDDLAFAFVAPLGAKDDGDGHRFLYK